MDLVGRPQGERFCPLLVDRKPESEEEPEDANLLRPRYMCRRDHCEWFDQELDCCAVRSMPFLLRMSKEDIERRLAPGNM